MAEKRKGSLRQNIFRIKKGRVLEEKRKKALSKRTLVSIFIILVMVPLTIIGAWRFGGKKYYLAGVLIIIYTMIPFFMVFENRKPQARELVVIAVMCAIAVASRAAFVMVPHFKPMVAIVIITGMAFGAEAGFLTGAVSGFVSNFIFGQGPWTPWQMFAFGIAGFLAGLLYTKGILKKNKLPLAIFGFVTTFALVGFLLDTCAIFTMAQQIDTTNIWKVYLAGVPVNLVHATAVALTLYIFSGPMFEKLDRIKIKYGMMEDEV